MCSSKCGATSPVLVVASKARRVDNLVKRESTRAHLTKRATTSVAKQLDLATATTRMPPQRQLWFGGLLSVWRQSSQAHRLSTKTVKRVWNRDGRHCALSWTPLSKAGQAGRSMRWLYVFRQRSMRASTQPTSLTVGIFNNNSNMWFGLVAAERDRYKVFNRIRNA